MTLDDAVAAFEAPLIPSLAPPGLPDDEVEGRCNMALSPAGLAYVLITSGGPAEVGGVVPAWFASEEAAVEEWLRHAWSYAEKRGGSRLYWRDRPVMKTVEFVALRQFDVMNDPLLRCAITTKGACVFSRLVISKLEGDEA